MSAGGPLRRGPPCPAPSCPRGSCAPWWGVALGVGAAPSRPPRAPRGQSPIVRSGLPGSPPCSAFLCPGKARAPWLAFEPARPLTRPAEARCRSRHTWGPWIADGRLSAPCRPPRGTFPLPWASGRRSARPERCHFAEPRSSPPTRRAAGARYLLGAHPSHYPEMPFSH
jgi:hypothetical protein